MRSQCLYLWRYSSDCCNQEQGCQERHQKTDQETVQQLERPAKDIKPLYTSLLDWQCSTFQVNLYPATVAAGPLGLQHEALPKVWQSQCCVFKVLEKQGLSCGDVNVELPETNKQP